MTRNSRFARGSGVYTCKSCGKKTRETGEGESSIRMCLLCHEIGAFENSLSDGGHPAPYSGVFSGCQTMDDVRARYDEECEKFGL